jgi:hypothetical protein
VDGGIVCELRIVAAIEMPENTWRELNAARTCYVPRKALMLKLVIILQY